jgi:isopentenyl-diphosphate delta-isomerase
MPAPLSTSLIDRVDDADRPIGVIERGRVFEEGANFRTIHIFVFNERGELLLQQLGEERKRNPLRWGSSVAGYLHQGESESEAAERRLREELGLTTPLEKYGSTWMNDQGSRKFITLYVTTASSPAIGEPGHIQRLAFRPTDEIAAELEATPEAFTETFRHVFRFYLATSSLPRE